MEMTPIEFEQYSLDLLKTQTNGLKNVVIKHNEIIEVDSGKYQLDGYIEFEVMGILYKTIVECKYHKYPIEREVIQKVYNTMNEVGAQKGVVITTSYFQSGALIFAKRHGIALIEMKKIEGSSMKKYNRKDVSQFTDEIQNEKSAYRAALIEMGVEEARYTYLKSNSSELKLFLIS